MGKYLHLFLGESAKTEHDEMYESGYTEPWAAFTDGLGMSYNKIQKPSEFSFCEYPYIMVDWSQIEEFNFKEMPSTADTMGFDICDGANIYYDEKKSTWSLCVWVDNGEINDCTEVSTVEEINEIINQSPIIDSLRTNGPLYDSPCKYIYAKPMEGYWPPEPIRKTFGTMTESDWEDFENVLSQWESAVSIYNVVPETEIFNQFITGSTEYVDVLIRRSAKGTVENYLFSWDGTQYSLWDGVEKEGEPIIITDENNAITDGIVRSPSNAKNFQVVWTVPSAVKQAF